MTLAREHRSDPQRFVDTSGGKSLAFTFVAVILVEVAVLVGLWLFSAHFSG